MSADPERSVARSIVRSGAHIEIGHNRHEAPRAVRVAAIGKAACAMARGAKASLGELAVEGVLVTDHFEPVPPPFHLIIGEHPFPGPGSLAGGRALLDMAQRSIPGDLLLVLVSGGGSSLAEVPKVGLEMVDLGTISRDLMAVGTPIEELNCVRRHLSLIKNGGLLNAVNGAAVESLLISDVADNPPSVIASGPTMTDRTTNDDAVAILSNRLEGALPDRIVEILNGEPPVDRKPASHSWNIIGDGATAAEAAVAYLRKRGFPSKVTSTTLSGEAATEATRQLHRAPAGVSVLTGETVVSGALAGLGGRNQEAALAAGVAISGRPKTLFGAIGSDGIDGPTLAAGAIVDSQTVKRGEAQGLDPSSCLKSHNSHTFLAASGDLVITGPTGTNIGDLWFVARR
jgi:glycerate 2-kinase